MFAWTYVRIYGYLQFSKQRHRFGTQIPFTKSENEKLIRRYSTRVAVPELDIWWEINQIQNIPLFARWVVGIIVHADNVIIKLQTRRKELIHKPAKASNIPWHTLTNVFWHYLWDQNISVTLNTQAQYI